RIFIDDISNGGKDATITSAIIALAHSLKLKIVAEGVENKQQVDFLTHLHCHELQGFYFSRPIPADGITLLLQKQAYPARIRSSS
ncbi:MAG: EAL domain-containing protein, partial [Thiohalomonadales bacterium]